jgi:hypothetical protein
MGYQAAQPAKRRRNAVAALLITLLILLVILGGVTAIVLRQVGFLGNNTPPPLAPTQQAQALLQRYYNDINNRNYHEAYNLLGTAFRQSQPYTQFVNGYAATQHDDITFGKTTTNADGTVQVNLTIHALETTSSGSTATSTYQGTDLVGQEHGAWKILSGNFQKIA